MLTDLFRLITRKKKPVSFHDLQRVEPVSSLFGTDRGLPIDRYYIEKFLQRNSGLIAGRVLEVGATTYGKRFGGKGVVSLEALHLTPVKKAGHVVADLTRTETVPTGRYDCFICTQTLNFIYEVDKVIESAHKLLRPGGVMLATVAGISQISRYDMDRWGDYWRFTTASMERLFFPAFGGSLEVESFGNSLVACAFLQGCAIEDLPDKSVLDRNDADYQMLITIVARKAN